MREPDYTKEENLKNLKLTIDAVISYGKGNFRAKTLAQMCKMVDGRPFNGHLTHLVDAKYLSREPWGQTYLYHFENLDALKEYHQEIKAKLEEIKRPQ